MSTLRAYLGTAGLTDVGLRFYLQNTAQGARITSSILDEGDGWYSRSGLTLAGDHVRWDSTATLDAIAREDLALRIAAEAIQAQTDLLPASPAATGDAMTLTAAYDAAKTALQDGGNVIATNMRGTDNALLAADYNNPPTANENADALLDRNVGSGSSTGRTVKQALAFLRNKWTLVGSTLTVYATDDTTVLWTATIASDPAADPVTGSDPA